MHTRRFSMAILGLWIGISVAMVFMATYNQKAVDHLLEAPATPASKLVLQFGVSSARMLLRYQVAEISRYFFDVYSLAQICLSVVLTVSLLFATNGNKLILSLCGLTMFMVVFQKYWLSPEMIYLGRMVDFVPEMVASPERDRFLSFQSAYLALDGVKTLVLLAIGAKMLVRTDGRRVRRSRSSEVDLATASAAD